jgi:predicted dithiol-disulfide oxidoreductase (DUF899 family)
VSSDRANALRPACPRRVIYHTYSAYARGLDGFWGMYQWLDRARRGRNETDETGIRFRRHDEYDSSDAGGRLPHRPAR